MPNQLSIPFKKTYAIELRQAVREHILKHHTDTHPDAFRWDINRWETLRKDGVGGVVHVDRVKAAISYHAQLVFVLTKLPPDIGLEIPYAPVFDSSALPINLSNLAYERSAVLFNLAALYSQLAASADRSTPQGLKQAIAYYQNAAGTLNYLASASVPQLRSSITPDDMPLELTEAFLASLEFLMLAQAQECVWQRAVMDNLKNGLIAKLAGRVASLYGSSLTKVKEASPSIRHVFPSHWLAHLETKQLHFEAAAQYRKSVDDLEANRYGEEIARLNQALLTAKKGYDTARRGGVASAVLHDIKSLLDNVQKSTSRAERDNDLIYHQEVPSLSALPPLQEVSVAQPVVPAGLADPKAAIGNDAVIFGDLLGWGAKVAIDIYKDRRETLIKEEVVDKAQQLNDTADKTLEKLNLPAALEALERPIGLPPSLLKKAEEVRLEEGPERVEASVENVRKLAKRNMDILNEAMDILDQEAEEDESFRTEHAVERLPSHEANVELTSKEERYRKILQQAADSDDLVRRKWAEWEKSIGQLVLSEAELEAIVPSSTLTLAQRSSRPGATATQTHARTLRALLESLDDFTRERAECVRRAKRIADSEDITPRILKAASAFAQWEEVQPAMLEDVLQTELDKYEEFIDNLAAGEQQQEVLLESISDRNDLFLQSRKDDTSVKERQHALQSLDLAYHKYKEITRNLDEGLKFYNDFAGVLAQFMETCKDWVNMRRLEIRSLTSSMQSMSLRSPTTSRVAQPEYEAPSPPGEKHRAAFDLPPPDSDEWEAMELPPGPAARPGKRTR
ncbi:pH-response regulator protein palA/RIM20 [Sparassis crispa]|uniref:pH-response regulator protein palA/RIM20 n=1 Tax=Sparassis crispa TaxID=139825 RepID=A0A401H0P6_9APHY|nr:pH-response regulator protein palA/RIM20 [Sparassis crispa]GBE87997.1 pH-response regulator protein palA/RIM20 [Sparassis crispa]